MDSPAATPAKGIQLAAALTQAIHIAEVQISNQVRQDLVANVHLQVWAELLSITQRLAAVEAPMVRKRDFGKPLRTELTGRRWDQFQRWFAREMGPALDRRSRESEVPALYAVRVSDKLGGHPNYRDAAYFVAFASPTSKSPEPLRRQVIRAHQGQVGASCSTEEKLQELERINDRLRFLLTERELEIDALRRHPRGETPGAR